MASRVIFVTLVLLVFGAVAACAGLLPLIWDGGYQLSVTLINQEPYYYLTRFHSWLLWWPTVWVSRVTENATALSLAYGLPFLLAPTVSMAVSWWFVRSKAPGLIVWAACGVAASLPGQAFVINDSIFQQTLAWPVILGAMVRINPVQSLAWVALAAFQFSHQIGLVILFFVAAAAWLSGNSWGKRAAASLLFVLAVLKTIWISVPAWSGRFFDSYAAQEASLSSAMWAFLTGVVGLPLAGLALLWLVAWTAMRRENMNEPLPAWWWKAMVGGLSLWVLWACVPNMWASAINYRRWVVPLAAPFVLMAILDARRGPADFGAWRQRLTLGIAGAFAVVMCAQGVAFRRQLERLQAAVASRGTPIVAATDLPTLKTYQLDHWGITTTLMVLQGRVPEQYLAYDADSLAAISNPPHRVSLWAPHPIAPEPGPAGWFDHRPLLEKVRARVMTPPATGG